MLQLLVYYGFAIVQNHNHSSLQLCFLFYMHTQRDMFREVHIQLFHLISLLVISCRVFFFFSFSFLSRCQFLTHVKRMMDVVPAHICVSSITTAQHPAPVHTSWSFQPTNSLVLVSENTLIFHVFSFIRVQIIFFFWLSTASAVYQLSYNTFICAKWLIA